MTQLPSEPARALRALNDDERLSAHESARAVVLRRLGEQPRRERFASATISQYPPIVLIIVGIVLALVFVGAALPSLFRLFTAGRDYFLHGIEDFDQAAIVGAATFLLSEFLIILSTIVARVFFTGRERLLFAVPIALGLLMALVGNWVIQQPTDLFGWLETVTPPIAVLFIALVGERLILDAIATRHGREVAYQRALAEWQQRSAAPEDSEFWRAAYINALKERLIAANASGQGATARRELMNTMSPGDWRPLLLRELNADRWHESIVEVEEAPAPPAPVPLSLPVVNGNGTGGA